jgi:hypothetical protein
MMSRVIGVSLAAALSLQSATAAVVVYDNSDGTFGWQIGLRDLSGIQRYGTYLDITQPPTQSGEKRAGTITKWYYANSSSSEPALRYLDGEGNAQTAGTTNDANATRDYNAGELVGSSDNWSGGNVYYWHLPFSSDLTTGTPVITENAHLGVRVRLADNQWHYGWIHFIDYRTPIAWAYETEPNVPIQIPVPSPSAATMLLALSTTAIATRSHR